MATLYANYSVLPLPTWGETLPSQNRDQRTQGEPSFHPWIFEIPSDLPAQESLDRPWLKIAYLIEIVAPVVFLVIAQTFSFVVSIFVPVLILIPLKLFALALCGHGLWNGALLTLSIWQQKRESSPEMQLAQTKLKELEKKNERELIAVCEGVMQKLAQRDSKINMVSWRELSQSRPYWQMRILLAQILAKQEIVEKLENDHRSAQKFYEKVKDDAIVRQQVQTYNFKLARAKLELACLFHILKEPTDTRTLADIGVCFEDIFEQVGHSDHYFIFTQSDVSLKAQTINENEILALEEILFA